MAASDIDGDDRLGWYAMQLAALGSVPQLRALWYVDQHEPTTAPAVAEELDVLDATARDKLRRLERVGLVTKAQATDRGTTDVQFRTTNRAARLLSTPPRDLLATHK